MPAVETAPSGFEGEGFPVRRALAAIKPAYLDPFVMMDQMGEVDYAAGEPKGTPWHPHRGFETVTYMIDGVIDHLDSNGGGGTITNGDTQWMTARDGGHLPGVRARGAVPVAPPVPAPGRQPGTLLRWGCPMSAATREVVRGYRGHVDGKIETIMLIFDAAPWQPMAPAIM